MSDLEARVREAFDAVLLPPEVKKATIAHVFESDKTAEHAEAPKRPAPEHLAPEQLAPEQLASKRPAPEHLASKRPAPEHLAPEHLASSVQNSSQPSPSAPAQNAPSSSPAHTQNSSQPSPSAQPVRRRAHGFTRRAGFALAACLLFALIGIGGYRAYAEETALIGVDLNPSLELGVNRFNRVVGARAINDDGQEVLNEVSVVGLSYDEALANISKSEAFSYYIYDDSFLDITVVCENSSQRSYLMEQSDKKIETLPYAGACNQMSSEEHHRAQSSGMGMGRYAAAQVLMELDASLSFEECKNMTMSELRDHITELNPDSEYAHHGNPSHEVKGEHGHGKGKGQGHRSRDANSQG